MSVSFEVSYFNGFFSICIDCLRLKNNFSPFSFFSETLSVNIFPSWFSVPKLRITAIVDPGRRCLQAFITHLCQQPCENVTWRCMQISHTGIRAGHHKRRRMVSIDWRHAGKPTHSTFNPFVLNNENTFAGLQLRVVRMHGGDIGSVVLQIPTGA